MNRRTLTLLTTFLTVTVAAFQAQAGEGLRDAKAHAERALRQYNLGNFEDAIAEFSKAYEIDASPVLLYNIAHAHRAAGHLDRAIFFYRRFLAESPSNVPNREKAQQYIHDLEERIAKQTEMPTTAPSSPAPGVSPPVQPSNAPAQRPAPPPPAPIIPPTVVGPKPGAQPAHESGSWKRTLAWIAGGGALIGLGTAVTFHAVGSGNFSDFNRSCVVDRSSGQAVPDPQSSTALTPARCSNLYDTWKSDRNWAIAGYTAAAVLAATSAALFISSSSTSSGAERRAHLDCQPGPATIVCGGTF